MSDYLAGISMQSDGSGLIWETRGGTFSTTDGGQTWRPTALGGTDAGPVAGSGWTIDDRTWLLLYWDPNAQQTLLELTRDAGARWAKLSVVPPAP